MGCGKSFEELDSIAFEELIRDVPCWNAWKREREARGDHDEIDLSGLDLSDAVLPEINLAYTNLRGARLDNAKLAGADLRGAKLDPRKSTGEPPILTDLTDADLTEANLSGADMKHAILVGANCTGANLNCRNLRLDHTKTRAAYLSPHAADPWSTLRRRYTGARMIFNLLFLGIFFLPLALRATAWATASQLQGRVLEATDSALVAAALATDEGSPAHAALTAVRPALEQHFPNEEAAEGWKQVPVWKLLLGLERETTFWILSLILLIYNLLRWLLTMVVAPMRDEEDRSGRSPPYRTSLPPIPPKGSRLQPSSWLESVRAWAREGFSSYGWLRWPDRVVRLLFWAAVIGLAINVRNWLALSVWIPTL